MGRGVSSGGGRSSLGYLFGGGENTPPKNGEPLNHEASAAAAAACQPTTGKDNPVPAGVHGTQTNNYFRADGQNCGNFLTDRPSTKVQAVPGGRSSLDYLFGGGGK